MEFIEHDSAFSKQCPHSMIFENGCIALVSGFYCETCPFSGGRDLSYIKETGNFSYVKKCGYLDEVANSVKEVLK